MFYQSGKTIDEDVKEGSTQHILYGDNYHLIKDSGSHILRVEDGGVLYHDSAK